MNIKLQFLTNNNTNFETRMEELASLLKDSHYSSIKDIAKYQPCFQKVLNAELSNLRSAFPIRKNRSTVSGGGRKPYRQKGTGRARQGSRRANQFVGGASCFGNQRRNYHKSFTVKEFNHAVYFLLQKKIILNIFTKDLINIKTKILSNLIKQNNFSNPLLIFTFDDLDNNKNLIFSFRNLKTSCLSSLNDLNLFTLFTFNDIFFTQTSFEQFTKRLKTLSLHSSLRKDTHKALFKGRF